MSDRDERIKKYKQHLLEEKNKELADNSSLINDFIVLCGEKGLQLNDSNFDYVPTIGLVAKYPNIVSLLDERIQPDKEELISYNFLESEFVLKPFASGYFYSDKFMLMAHSFFRRGYYHGNNFSPRFIDTFWQYPVKDNDRYIALDMDRVRINVDDSMYMELDTWYGAKFNKNPEEIEDGIVKLRPPLDLESFEIEFLFGDTYSLDIKWYTKDNIKVFQAEEFKAENNTVEQNEETYYPARYIHSEYDITKKEFRHFDGAIHFYTEEEYFQRRDSDFNYNDKNDLKVKTASKKIFKINGSVSMSDWIELTSHFLTGNPLVFEYFEGKLPDRIIETVQELRNSRN